MKINNVKVKGMKNDDLGVIFNVVVLLVCATDLGSALPMAQRLKENTCVLRKLSRNLLPIPFN
jgi:hypothetical protein